MCRARYVVARELTDPISGAVLARANEMLENEDTEWLEALLDDFPQCYELTQEAPNVFLVEITEAEITEEQWDEMWQRATALAYAPWEGA